MGPMYCATSILSETCVRRYEKWLNILGGILQGYDHENKLTLEEKQAVFYVICSIQMICAAYFESQKGLSHSLRLAAKCSSILPTTNTESSRYCDS